MVNMPNGPVLDTQYAGALFRHLNEEHAEYISIWNEFEENLKAFTGVDDEKYDELTEPLIGIEHIVASEAFKLGYMMALLTSQQHPLHTLLAVFGGVVEDATADSVMTMMHEKRAQN